MDASLLFPRERHDDLNWLGGVPPQWMTIQLQNIDGSPGARIRIDFGLLLRHPGAAGRGNLLRMLESFHDEGSVTNLYYIEAGARFLHDGPKLFCPTSDMFEAMEQVEIRVPFCDLRIPYPALAVRVPDPCRDRLADRFGLPRDLVPKLVLIRRRDGVPGSADSAFTFSRFGSYEMFFSFGETDSGETVEDTMNRTIPAGPDSLGLTPFERDRVMPCAKILDRAAMNLALLLARGGAVPGGPLDPEAYRKHRARKHLRHLRFADFTTVKMKQQIEFRKVVVRPTDNPPGPGTGIEVKPHWRRGHWRCYPGQAARRAAGERVDLLFVRPCLVRPDRAVGELCETEVEYQGRP